MHAVVVTVTIHDQEAGERHLREQVVPGVSQAPGFVTGYWTRKDDSGLAMVVFESEEAASGMVERTPRCFLTQSHSATSRSVRSWCTPDIRPCRATPRFGYSDSPTASSAAGRSRPHSKRTIRPSRRVHV